MWKPWQQPVGTSLWHIAFILCEVWGRVQVLLWEKMEPGPWEPRTFQNGGRPTTTAEQLPVWLLSDHSPVKSQEAESANRLVPAFTRMLQMQVEILPNQFFYVLFISRRVQRVFKLGIDIFFFIFVTQVKRSFRKILNADLCIVA